MVDTYYTKSSTSELRQQLQDVLEDVLQDTNDQYKLSDLLTHLAIGKAVEDGLIVKTGTGFEIEIDSKMVAMSSIEKAVDYYFLKHFDFGSGFIWAAAQVGISLFETDYKSDYSILDNSGNVIAGIFSEDPANPANYKAKFELLLNNMQADNTPLPVGATQVQVITDLDNPTAQASKDINYLVNTGELVSLVNDRSQLGDFYSWSHGSNSNNDNKIAGRDYLFLNSLDGSVSNSDKIIINYHDGTTDKELLVDWDEIDIAGGVTDKKVYLKSLSGNTGDNIIFGTQDDDTLIGRGGQDVLFGFEGHDTFEYRSRLTAPNELDGDIYHGGYNLLPTTVDGRDTIDYSKLIFASGSNGIRVSLGDDEAFRLGTTTTDQLISIEDVVGSQYDDVILGQDAQNNVLVGGLGQDELYGLGGNDTLVADTNSIEGDLYDGGDDYDSVNYSVKYQNSSLSSGLHFLQFSQNEIRVSESNDFSGITDHIYNVEEYELSGKQDIFTFASNDTSSYNMTVIGGGGSDRIIFGGNYSDYKIMSTVIDSRSGISVDYNSGSREDLLSGIEILEFADGEYQDSGFSTGENRGPIADSDIASVAVDGSVNIQVQNNDIDPEGDALSITNVSAPSNGSVQLLSDGTITYTPNTGFSGLDSFTYTISDPDGLTSTATVNVSVGSGLSAGTSGADSLTGSSSADVIDGAGGNDTIIGDAGDDLLYGGAGNDILSGGVGNDTIYGGDGNDEFSGSDGIENLFGGKGSDKYLFDMSVDTGSVGVNESSVLGTDTIYLTNVAAGNRIEFEYDSATDQLNSYYFSTSAGTADFVVSINAGEALAGRGVESFSIDGDKIYSAQNIINAAKESVGETFIFDIEAYEVDGYLAVLPESSSGVSVPVVADPLKGTRIFADWGTSSSLQEKTYAEEYFQGITFTGSGNPDNLTPDVNGQYTAPVIGYIETLDFHDGISRDDIRLTVDNNANAGLDIHIESLNITYHYDYFEDGYTITGYAFDGGNVSGAGSGGSSGSYTVRGDNLLWGSSSTSQTYFFERILFSGGFEINLRDVLKLEGTDASETLYGLDRADRIYGYDGADTLNAGAGSDTLIGGAGNDTLQGGQDNDTYIYNVGDGTDTIYEYLNEGTDTLHLAGTLDPSSYRLYTEANGIFRVESKTDTNDQITLYATSTNIGGYNQNEIADYFEQITFDDGTVWDLTNGLTLEGTDTAGESLYGTEFADTLYGYDGVDTLWGNSGLDTLIGGAGNDTLLGGLGDDTYVFNVGDGTDSIQEFLDYGSDTLHLAGMLDPSSYRLYTEANGIFRVESKTDTNDQITLYATSTNIGGYNQNEIADYFEQITFDDGTVWDLTNGLTLEGTDTAGESLYGTEFADTLYGYDGVDTLWGNSGLDTLIGGAGNDTLLGGLGDDTYVFNVGDGTDSIQEFLDYGSDTLHLAGMLDPSSYRLYTEANGIFRVESKTDTNDQITLYATSTNIGGYNQNEIADYFEQITFDDGTVWDLTNGLTLEGTDTAGESLYGTEFADTLYGYDGVDTLWGNSGLDTLIGGAGNDTLLGGLGNDIFVFETGFGDDTIGDWNVGDTINLTAFSTIRTVNDLTITAVNGNSLITIGTGETITINSKDSTSWTNDDFILASVIDGTSADDTIYGTVDADFIYGLGGNDYIFGDDGDDTIYGGDGDDNLYGNGGVDTLYGEAGDDLISGHAESDTIYGGDGHDDLFGYESSDLIYGGAGNDKIYGDDQDSLDTYTLGAADELHGGDGNDQIFAGIGDDVVYGDDGADDLYGYGDNDTLYGGLGNDRLYGGDGNDTLYGDDGSDSIYGGDGDDVITGGNGRDYLNGEGGADTFYLDLDDVDRVRDFELSENDSINIADLLTGFDSATDDVNDFVDIVIRSSTRTDIRVDVDGVGGNFQYVGIIYSDLTGETVDSLVASGALITE